MNKKSYTIPQIRTIHLVASPLLQDTASLQQGQGNGGNVTETNQRDSHNNKDSDWGNLW